MKTLEEKIISGCKRENEKYVLYNFIIYFVKPFVVIYLLTMMALFNGYIFFNVYNVILVTILVVAICLIIFLHNSYIITYSENNIVIKRMSGNQIIMDMKKYPHIYIKPRQIRHGKPNMIFRRIIDELNLQQNEITVPIDLELFKKENLEEFLDNFIYVDGEQSFKEKYIESSSNNEKTHMELFEEYKYKIKKITNEFKIGIGPVVAYIWFMITSIILLVVSAVFIFYAIKNYNDFSFTSIAVTIVIESIFIWATIYLKNHSILEMKMNDNIMKINNTVFDCKNDYIYFYVTKEKSLEAKNQYCLVFENKKKHLRVAIFEEYFKNINKILENVEYEKVKK